MYVRSIPSPTGDISGKKANNLRITTIILNETGVHPGNHVAKTLILKIISNRVNY